MCRYILKLKSYIKISKWACSFTALDSANGSSSPLRSRQLLLPDALLDLLNSHVWCQVAIWATLQWTFGLSSVTSYHKTNKTYSSDESGARCWSQTWPVPSESHLDAGLNPHTVQLTCLAVCCRSRVASLFASVWFHKTILCFLALGNTCEISQTVLAIWQNAPPEYSRLLLAFLFIYTSTAESTVSSVWRPSQPKADAA